jgi:hypothetical protein
MRVALVIIVIALSLFSGLIVTSFSEGEHIDQQQVRQTLPSAP